MDAYLLYDWWVSSDTFLSEEHKQHNALNLFAYLHGQGWSTEAIAGAAGNFEIEARFNPGYFQSHAFSDWPTLERALRFTGGYGLAQWTPAKKYLDPFITTTYPGSDYRNGWAQAYRLTLTKGMWVKGNVGGITFAEYIIMTRSPEEMSKIWCKAYERPASPDYAARAQAARAYYVLFTETPEEDLPTPPENPMYPGEPPIPPGPGPDPDPKTLQLPYWLLFKFNQRRF